MEGQVSLSALLGTVSVLVVGAILIGFWYILFRRLPPNISESFNLCSFMQTGF